MNYSNRISKKLGEPYMGAYGAYENTQIKY